MGHLRAEHFFTKEERERVRQTTKDVECCTSGEVVVMVVDRSDEYPDGVITGGVLMGSFMAMIVTEFFFHASMWFFIPLACLFFIPARLAMKALPRLRTFFITSRRREQAVRHRAVRAFHEKGLTKTRDRTGVLFFISLMERKVWVLADKGIHEKIGQETLNGFAAAVSKGIAGGRGCDALCGAIRESGKLLAIHFPLKPGDINELGDDIITG